MSVYFDTALSPHLLWIVELYIPRQSYKCLEHRHFKIRFRLDKEYVFSLPSQAIEYMSRPKSDFIMAIEKFVGHDTIVFCEIVVLSDSYENNLYVNDIGR